MARAKALSDRQRYRLIELLDPSLTHYEFFLARPPLLTTDWSEDVALKKAIPERHPCIQGWPGRNFLDYEYRIVNLSEAEYQFLVACDRNLEHRRNVEEILTNCSLDLEAVRSLWSRKLIILSSQAKQEIPK
jgi:hypothetical protein